MSHKIPNGFVFSPNSPSRKKKALLLSAILIVLQLCFLWPIYPLFASPTPQILGFPLSFIWPIFVLILSSLAVFIFYLKDTEEEQ